MSKTVKGFSRNAIIIGIAVLVIGLIVILFVLLSSSSKKGSTATVSTANLNTNREQPELISPLTTAEPKKEDSVSLLPTSNSKMPDWSIDSSDLPESISANQSFNQPPGSSAAQSGQRPDQPPSRNNGLQPGTNPQSQNSSPGQPTGQSSQQPPSDKLAMNSQPPANSNIATQPNSKQTTQPPSSGQQPPLGSGRSRPPGPANSSGNNAWGSGSANEESSNSNNNSSESGASGDESSWGQPKRGNDNMKPKPGGVSPPENGKSKPGAGGLPPDGGAWGSGNGNFNPGSLEPRNRNGNSHRGNGQFQQGDNPEQQNPNQEISLQQPGSDGQLALTDQPAGSDLQQNNPSPDQNSGNFPPGGQGGDWPPQQGDQNQPGSDLSQSGNDNSQSGLVDSILSMLNNGQSSSVDDNSSSSNSGGLGSLLSDNQISDMLKQLVSPDQLGSGNQGSSENTPQSPVGNLTRMLPLQNIVNQLMNLIKLLIPQNGAQSNVTSTTPTTPNPNGDLSDNYCPAGSYLESSGTINACLTAQLDINCTKSGGTWQTSSGSTGTPTADSNLSCTDDTPVFYNKFNANNLPNPIKYYCRCNADQCVEADTATCAQNSQPSVQDPSEINCENSGGSWQNMDCGVPQEFCGSESVETNCQGVYQYRCVCPPGTCWGGPTGFCTNSPGITEEQRKSNCGVSGGTWKQFVDQCVANQQKCLYREIGQNVCTEDQYQNSVWGCGCSQDQCLTESGRCAPVYNY
jgi:hypothetical protein